MALAVGENSWLTLEEAETYFSTRIGSSEYWCSGADKEAALITAYNQLNGCGLFDFPAAATQAMKDAQCEQALFLLIHGEDIDRRKGLQAQGVTAAGIVKESYKEDIDQIPICTNAKNFLKEYSIEGQDIYAVDLERDEEEDIT